MTLEELLNTKPVSIYSVLNTDTKNILICYTIETIGSVLHRMKCISENPSVNKKAIQIRFIETYNTKNVLYLKWRVHELYKEHIKLGYTPDSSYKPLEWKLYVSLYDGSGDNRKVEYKAFVKLKTSANVVYTIQEFDNVQLADKFVEDNTIETVVRSLK